MPTLSEIKLTELPEVLVLPHLSYKEWKFKDYPGMAIRRIDHSSYWVYDVRTKKGVMMPGYDAAKQLLIEMVSLDF